MSGASTVQTECVVGGAVLKLAPWTSPEGCLRHSPGITAALPTSFRKKATNFAGTVWLAFRPTV
jgi:hypothetical protein